jgi:hypothetical protein
MARPWHGDTTRSSSPVTLAAPATVIHLLIIVSGGRYWRRSERKQVGR